MTQIKVMMEVIMSICDRIDEKNDGDPEKRF